MTTIQIEFQLNAEDYQRAAELQRLRRSKLLRFIQTTLVLAVSVVFAGIVVPDLSITNIINNPWPAAAAILIAAVMSGPTTRSIRRRALKATFKKEKSYHKPISYRVSEEFIELAGPDFESKVKWSLFTDWTEDETLFLLLQDRLMYVIPKRSLVEPEDQERLRKLITDKLGPS